MSANFIDVSISKATMHAHQVKLRQLIWLQHFIEIRVVGYASEKNYE